MKKAQFEYLKYIILALVFLLIIAVPFVLKIREAGEQAARLTQCKSTIEANARMRVSGIDFSESMICPAKELTIASKDQTEIKHTLAEEMIECWDIYKRGEAELFTGEGTFCAVCSRIDFKDKDMEIKAFSKYLAETPMGSGQTYLGYLSGYSTEDAEKVLGDQPETNYNFDAEAFPTDKDYAVILVYAKGKDSLEKLGNFLAAKTTASKIGYTAAGISITAGGVIGAGLAFFGIVSNPVGWAIGIAGAITAAGSLVSSYFLDPVNTPEWASLVMFTDYTAERLDEIGCEYMPVEQS